MSITETLLSLKDAEYKAFHSKLMPTIAADRIIGIRIPVLKKLARTLPKKDFIAQLPHFYYEENNLHAFMISDLEWDECIYEVNRFLPHVDNWATCDSLRPKCFAKNRGLLIHEIDRWLISENPYTVRFGIEMLMVHFLGENFKTEYADRVAEIKSCEYYVNMMSAWYFATALAKNYKEIIPYLERGTLDVWVHNKTIQKACESYRISDTQKAYLKKLKKQRQV